MTETASDRLYSKMLHKYCISVSEKLTKYLQYGDKIIESYKISLTFRFILCIMYLYSSIRVIMPFCSVKGGVIW